MKIQDDTGTGQGLRINGRNEAAVFSVAETEAQAATELGLAYNLNTGDITGLTAGDASLIYVKNDEEEDLLIELLAVGLRGFTGLTDMAVVTIIRNPTAGDIISDATAVDMNKNRNFGSSKTLSPTTLVYKGKAAGTFTDGDDIIQFYVNNNSRLAATISLELPRGSSIGVKVESDATAGTAYAALVLHKKDDGRK